MEARSSRESCELNSALSICAQGSAPQRRCDNAACLHGDCACRSSEWVAWKGTGRGVEGGEQEGEMVADPHQLQEAVQAVSSLN